MLPIAIIARDVMMMATTKITMTMMMIAMMQERRGRNDAEGLVLLARGLRGDG